MTSCAQAGALQVLVDPYWAWQDPRREADVVVPADPDQVMEAMMMRVPEAGAPGRSAWAAPLTWSDGWRKPRRPPNTRSRTYSAATRR